MLRSIIAITSPAAAAVFSPSSHLLDRLKEVGDSLANHHQDFAVDSADASPGSDCSQALIEIDAKFRAARKEYARVDSGPYVAAVGEYLLAAEAVVRRCMHPNDFTIQVSEVSRRSAPFLASWDNWYFARYQEDFDPLRNAVEILLPQPHLTLELSETLKETAEVVASIEEEAEENEDSEDDNDEEVQARKTELVAEAIASGRLSQESFDAVNRIGELLHQVVSTRMYCTNPDPDLSMAKASAGLANFESARLAATEALAVAQEALGLGAVNPHAARASSN